MIDSDGGAERPLPVRVAVTARWSRRPRELQARGRRSARGSLSKIAKPTATRCSLPSMVTLTFMTYHNRPSIRASRGGHEGSRVYEAYNSKHVLVLTRLSHSASSLVTMMIS